MRQTVELKLSPPEAADEKRIALLAAQKCGLPPNETLCVVRRRSIDARSRQPYFVIQVEVYHGELPPLVPTYTEHLKPVTGKKKAIIIGAGPAGYFAALELLAQGIQPIVLERGKDVRTRRRDLRAIQQEGIVNPHSNYCFGEGGAGTYSDGKLYTRSKKRGDVQQALQILVEHGASPTILVDTHPHIGSNKLPDIVANLRHTIEKNGGEVHFDTFVTDFVLQQQHIKGVVANEGNRVFYADAVVLATGHSARDIFRLLQRQGIAIEPKPFALGVRIEHPQQLIDSIQYHCPVRSEFLPASSYSLVTQVDNRGVFSFCMCPGGLIVPAATAPGEIVVNGMSMSRRDSKYANSGTVVSVELADLPASLHSHRDLMAMYFQQHVEQAMFGAGDGSQKAPAQRLTDFVKGTVSSSLPSSSYIPGLFCADVHRLLPPFIYKRLQKGIQEFGKKMHGYYTHEAVVVGTESRTSSPVKIPRLPDTLMHPQIQGLFPSGEGAGYAGGILSAAMDGRNVAKALAQYIYATRF
jgi:uncharacterized FAD-dependent dehydrogenase